MTELNHNVPTVTVGVIGFGYWGPNHVRNMSALAGEDVIMTTVAEMDPLRRKRAQMMFPSLTVVEDASTLFEDDRIDAVVIATPAHTHETLIRQALNAGKHVLVEKPMTTNVAAALELTERAQERGLTLMVGHTFEYTPAVDYIRSLVDSDGLGRILYIRSQRVNLGQHQSHINVLWDLAPHDVSIIIYLLGALPTHATAQGRAHVDSNIDDIVSLNLEFENNVMANIILSWLDPQKVREMTIIGSDKMLVYDDVDANDKIKIYDKGVEMPPEYRSFGEFQVSYRYGDMVSPRIENFEPLAAQSKHFIECLRQGKRPRSDGESGRRVVQVLAAAQLSLNRGGTRTSISDPEILTVDGNLRSDTATDAVRP